MTTFIFLDLETTGLNSQTDEILEIYAEVHDESLDESIATFHAVIKPDRMPENIPQRVVDMHSKNGLWRDVEDGESQKDVMNRLREFFAEFPGALLVGRNVGTFDKQFLETKMPGITEKLHYRCIDISTMLTLFTLYGGPDLGPSVVVPHRSHGDVMLDLDTMRKIADWLGDVG